MTVDRLHSQESLMTKYSHTWTEQANIETLHTCLMSLLLNLSVCLRAHSTRWCVYHLMKGVCVRERERHSKRSENSTDLGSRPSQFSNLWAAGGIFPHNTKLFSLDFIQWTSPSHSFSSTAISKLGCRYNWHWYPEPLCDFSVHSYWIMPQTWCSKFLKVFIYLFCPVFGFVS